MAVIAAIGWTILTVGSVVEVMGATSVSAEETVYGAVGLGAAGSGMIIGYPAQAAAHLGIGLALLDETRTRHPGDVATEAPRHEGARGTVTSGRPD